MSELDFTDAEADQVRAALYDRAAETERYLSSYGDPLQHDPCCERALAIEARWAEEREYIKGRLALIRSALAKVGG